MARTNNPESAASENHPNGILIPRRVLVVDLPLAIAGSSLLVACSSEALPAARLPIEQPHVPLDPLGSLIRDGFRYLGNYEGTPDPTRPGVKQYSGILDRIRGKSSETTYPFVRASDVSAPDFLIPRLVTSALPREVGQGERLNVELPPYAVSRFKTGSGSSIVDYLQADVLNSTLNPGKVARLTIEGYADAGNGSDYIQAFTLEDQEWRITGQTAPNRFQVADIATPTHRGEIRINAGTARFTMDLVPKN